MPEPLRSQILAAQDIRPGLVLGLRSSVSPTKSFLRWRPYCRQIGLHAGIIGARRAPAPRSAGMRDRTRQTALMGGRSRTVTRGSA